MKISVKLNIVIFMNNSYLRCKLHVINDLQATFDGVPVEEKLQRAMEKFQRGVEGGLVGSLCSRNPHDETVVDRRT